MALSRQQRSMKNGQMSVYLPITQLPPGRREWRFFMCLPYLSSICVK